MYRPGFHLLILAFLVCCAVTVSAQISVEGSFNPGEVGGICGLGFDPETGDVWVYGCFGADLQRYSASGVYISSIPRPGESANDVDITITQEDLTLDGTLVPGGSLLFINGESGAVEIYALDKNTGDVIATLNTSYGNSHVVGGAFHPLRHTFFLVQDKVAAADVRNRIGEVSPLTGDPLQVFEMPNDYVINYGDLEISGETGNLFLVSSDEESIAEISSDGSWVTSHALPQDVTDLSGLAIDCASSEAWVSSSSGTVTHLSGLLCGNTSGVGYDMPDLDGFTLESNFPNPFNPQTTIAFEIPRQESVTLLVFDMSGRLVREFSKGDEYTAGRHEVVWKGRDDSGRQVASGTYFYRLEAGSYSETKRMVLIK